MTERVHTSELSIIAPYLSKPASWFADFVIVQTVLLLPLTWFLALTTIEDAADSLTIEWDEESFEELDDDD